jgi:hypothetical protein
VKGGNCDVLHYNFVQFLVDNCRCTNMFSIVVKAFEISKMTDDLCDRFIAAVSESCFLQSICDVSDKLCYRTGTICSLRGTSHLNMS